MKIDIRKNRRELFTGVYRKLRRAETRYVVVYGGSGSSKSYSVHQLELFNLLKRSRGDTLVIRKYGADLRESCYKLFGQLIDGAGLRPYFRFTYSADNRRISFKKNGCSLIFRGIDDPEKLKSIVGIRRIVIEEASQLSFDDFLELNRRARGMEGIQIIFILNPISENHWIKTQFCDEGSPYYSETTVLRFTYRDNCNGHGKSFLTAADIRELERLKEINENQYRIYVEAEWGVDNKEGKFCWAFDRSQIKSTQLDPEVSLWASFDFNVNPLTCTVAQVWPYEKKIRAIACFKLENSDIWKMCERLNAAYPDVTWLVTGDATGRNRSALIQDNIDYYGIISKLLNLAPAQLRTPSVNPSIEQNRVVVNWVHKCWDVAIDPQRCQPLIYDLTYVEVDGEGGIIKDRSSLKKFADFLDNWRYLINSAIRPHFTLGAMRWEE